MNRYIAASCLSGLGISIGIMTLTRLAGAPFWSAMLIILAVVSPVGFYWGRVAVRANRGR